MLVICSKKGLFFKNHRHRALWGLTHARYTRLFVEREEGASYDHTLTCTSLSRALQGKVGETSDDGRGDVITSRCQQTSGLQLHTHTHTLIHTHTHTRSCTCSTQTHTRSTHTHTQTFLNTSTVCIYTHTHTHTHSYTPPHCAHTQTQTHTHIHTVHTHTLSLSDRRIKSNINRSDKCRLTGCWRLCLTTWRWNIPDS